MILRLMPIILAMAVFFVGCDPAASIGKLDGDLGFRPNFAHVFICPDGDDAVVLLGSGSECEEAGWGYPMHDDFGEACVDYKSDTIVDEAQGFTLASFLCLVAVDPVPSVRRAVHASLRSPSSIIDENEFEDARFHDGCGTDSFEQQSWNNAAGDINLSDFTDSRVVIEFALPELTGTLNADLCVYP